MIYLIMRLLSENPAGGPQLFGILCDLLILLAVIILVFGTKGEKN